MEENHKGVRYADYFFLLAILFIFLIFFCLLCTGGLIATRWSYKRRTKERLDEEREKHRRDEDAWKECERKLREETDRKNEKALERELLRKFEAKESKPHTTVIKMETPTKLQEALQQQQPICNHHNSQQFPTNNGQPLVQTVFIPQPIYPPSSFPSQYFPPPQQHQPLQGNFQHQQQYQSYFGQPLQAGITPQPEQPQNPSSKRSPRKSSPKEESPKRKVSTKKKSKRENKNDNSSKHDATIKMPETDVEFETSQPSTSTSTLPVLSTSNTNTKSSDVPQTMDDSDLPYLSSDFEISKLQNSSKKKKKRKHKSPLSKKFRKINQSTTVTERKAVKETLPFQSRNPFTSIKATTIPTSRIVTSENTVDHLYFKPTNPKHPKKWKRRMSPFSDISSKDNSLTSFASPSSLSNVIPTTSQSSTTFTEFDTDMENNEDDETTATTSTTRTPKIVEIETSELETTTSTTATSTIPTESSKASTPIITEPDENTERTQSPLKNGIQSPTSISVEMTSPPPSITAVQKKKEKTKIGCRPKVVAEVVQVLAKYKESDVRRLPNERFELINEEESPKKHLTKSSSPAAITTTSTKSSSPSAVTSSTVTTKSSPLASTKSSTSPSSTQVDLFNTAQIAAPQFSPGPPRTLADSNDPFLSNNPYWRSRTERITQIEKLRSPNSGRVNGIEVKSKETALWLPMKNGFEKLEEEKKSNNNNEKLPAASSPPKLHRAQVIEIIKTDKTQESP